MKDLMFIFTQPLKGIKWPKHKSLSSATTCLTASRERERERKKKFGNVFKKVGPLDDDDVTFFIAMKRNEVLRPLSHKQLFP